MKTRTRKQKRRQKSTRKAAKNGTNYFKYLDSKNWRKKRRQVFAKCGRKCSVCGATRALRIHHKTYDRLGSERVSDLQVLCDGCHANLHEGEVVGAMDPMTREFLALTL